MNFYFNPFVKQKQYRQLLSIFALYLRNLMIKITVEEFQNRIDELVQKGVTEKIQVIFNDKPIFTIVPEKETLLDDWDKIFGTLPEEILNDNDIDRE